MADSGVVATAGWEAKPGSSIDRNAIFGTLLLLGVALVTFAPVVYVVVASFDVGEPSGPYVFGLDGWAEIMGNRRTWNAIVVTLWLSLRVPIALLVAFLICWLLIRVEIPGRRWIEMALWFGFFLPALPMTMGWILLLDENYGLVNVGLKNLGLTKSALFSIHSIPGLMWVHIALTTVPVMVILLAPAFRQLDSAYEEAAEVSGASGFYLLRKVTVPLLAPALLTAFLASFIRSLEAFEIEQVVGVPAGIYNYGTRIYDLIFHDPPLFPQTLALSAVFLMLLLLMAIPYHRYLVSAGNRPTITGRGVRLRTGAKPAWTWIASGIVFVYIACTILVPFVVLILGSFTRLFGFFFLKNPYTANHWVTVLTDERFGRAAFSSIGLGLTVGVLGVVIFALLAWALVRTNWPGRGLVSLLVWLPWAIPGLVLSLTLMAILVSVPIFRPINGTLIPLIFAMIVKDLPVGVQLVRSSLTQISSQLEEAAEVSGAGFVTLFVRITLPLIAPTLVAVFLLAFAATIRDISTIVLIAPPGVRTLSLLMFDYAVSGRFEPSAVLGVIVALISLAMTMLAYRLGSRRGLSS